MAPKKKRVVLSGPLYERMLQCGLTDKTLALALDVQPRAVHLVIWGKTKEFNGARNRLAAQALKLDLGDFWQLLKGQHKHARAATVVGLLHQLHLQSVRPDPTFMADLKDANLHPQALDAVIEFLIDLQRWQRAPDNKSPCLPVGKQQRNQKVKKKRRLVIPTSVVAPATLQPS